MHKDIPMYTPGIRAHMEQIIKDVAEGKTSKDEAIAIIKENMRQNYIKTYGMSHSLVNFITDFINENRDLRYD